MEHPFVSDLSSLTQEQVQAQLSDLTKKLSFAQRTGNAQLCNQLRMAIESYNNEYQRRMAALLAPKGKEPGPDYSSKINIS